MNNFLKTFLLALTLLATPTPAQDKPLLTVYTYDSFTSEWGAGPKVEAAFERRCECDLRFVAVDNSTGILSRIQLEGTNSPADVVLGLDNSLIQDAEQTGLIQPHGVDMSGLNNAFSEQSSGESSEQSSWKNPYFLPFDFGYFAFIYDSTKISNPPTSFEQLINMDKSIKIVIQDPRSSTSGLGLLVWIKALYGDQAEAIWTQLAPRILTVTKGWWESYSMFLQGEADMVLSYTTSPAFHIITEQEHKYRAAQFTAGHGMQIEVAGILKNAPNPQLAKQFMAFIRTAEFQQIIPTTNWMFPAFMPADQLPPQFKQLITVSKSLTINPQQIAANRSAWIDEFNRALTQ